MLPLSMMLGIGATVLIAVLLALTVSDVLLIRLQRRIKQHPHARRWRERPTIYVVDPTASVATMTDLRSTGYRKMKVVTLAPSAGLRLHIHSGLQLAPGSLTTALRLLAQSPWRSSVSLVPNMADPTTLIQLLRQYALIAQLPFHILRSLFGTLPINGVVLRRSPGRYARAYELVAWAIKVLSLVLFIYACVTASFYDQPQLALLFTATLWAWLLWTVGRYPYFSWRKKTLYTMLLPVSFVYFIYLLIAAPFAPLRQRGFLQNGMIVIGNGGAV